MSAKPEAMRLADELEDSLESNDGSSLSFRCQDIADKAAAELRRLHQHELALAQWIEKTEWVGYEIQPHELGRHRVEVDLLDALRVCANQSTGPDWTPEQALHFIKQHAKAAIANATERTEMNKENADYKAGFRAGMEYQEMVEIDLMEALVALLDCPAGDYDTTEDYANARKKARAAIDKATKQEKCTEPKCPYNGQLVSDNCTCGRKA